MVFEATYLVAVLTAGQMSLCCGQNGAQISKVLRPINKSNGMFICFLMAVERTGSECGLIHPPYAKPPLVSSSGPPGACMTPSRETNSSTSTPTVRRSRLGPTVFPLRLSFTLLDTACASSFPVNFPRTSGSTSYAARCTGPGAFVRFMVGSLRCEDLLCFFKVDLLFHVIAR